MNSSVKKEKEDLVIINEDISMEKILENDKMAPCYGGIAQYILDLNGRLKGIITSYDIEHSQGIKEKCINRKPIKLLDGSLTETLADKIFEETSIRSIPVVDDGQRLLYVLERINGNPSKKRFCEYIGWDVDIDYVRNTVMDMRTRYQDKKVYLITTEDLPELEDISITLEELDGTIYDRYILVFAFRYEYDALHILKKLREQHIKYFICPLLKHQFRYSVMKYVNTDRTGMEVLKEEARKNGLYYDAEDFSNMFQALQLTKDVEGCLVEIGVFRGDSARAMLSYMKKNNMERKGYFLDLFEGFVYPDAMKSEDLAVPLESPHTDTSEEIVKRRLEEFENIKILKTDIIQDPLPEEIGPIAICNIDMAMYETEHAALNKVKDKMSGGGVIIAHNYGRTPGCVGAYLAIKEFYEENQNFFYGIYMESGQFLMIRK